MTTKWLALAEGHTHPLFLACAGSEALLEFELHQGPSEGRSSPGGALL